MAQHVMRDLIEATLSRRSSHRAYLRVGALVLFAAVLVLLPQAGPNRTWAVGLLIASAPVPLLCLRLKSMAHRHFAQSLFEVVLTPVVIALVPTAWFAGLVIVSAVPVAATTLLGRKRYVLLEFIGLALMAGAGAGSHVEGWFLPWLVAVMLVPFLWSYVGVFLSEETSASAQLDHLADATGVLFWELDWRTKELTNVTGRLHEVLGYSLASLPNKIEHVLHIEDQKVLVRADPKPGRPVQLTSRVRHAEGHWVWMRVSFQRVQHGSDVSMRGIAMDISELVELAETDELTGLANRSVLNRQLDRFLAEGTNLALVLLDLDRFKEVNDTLGHHSGDQYLVEVARSLQAAAPDCLVARLGGDEFAIVAPGLGTVAAGSELAQRVAAACEHPVSIDGLEFAGSASCGLVVSPAHGNDATELMRRADVAMYAAKRAGVRYRLFSDDTPGATVDRLTLSGEVQGALSRGELRLWYQPKVELSTGRIVGAEGLLRWHHPERGVLRPKDFLDVVEISRHYPALTRELIDQAVQTLKAQNSGQFTVSVNVSIRNLGDPGFTQHVIRSLDAAAVDPQRLVLEITEREIMRDNANIAGATERLRSLGVGLSIDDFGTGHSSLVRLHELPVTELKIDKRFIAALGRDEHAGVIVKAVVDLAAGLGHSIVAEGVEAQYQVDRLQELGCELAQGYFWSEALPLKDLAALLGEVNSVPTDPGQAPATLD